MFKARASALHRVGHARVLALHQMPASVLSQRRKALHPTFVIDFQLELDRLAADLAVLDVACGTGTRIDRRFEMFTAIGTLDQVKLHAVGGARKFPRKPDVYDGLEAVLLIDAPCIAWRFTTLE